MIFSDPDQDYYETLYVLLFFRGGGGGVGPDPPTPPPPQYPRKSFVFCLLPSKVHDCICLKLF